MKIKHKPDPFKMYLWQHHHILYEQWEELPEQEQKEIHNNYLRWIYSGKEKV